MLSKLRKCPNCGHEGGLIRCPVCHSVKEVKYKPKRWEQFDDEEKAFIALVMTASLVRSAYSEEEPTPETLATEVEITCRIVSEINMSMGNEGVNDSLLRETLAVLRRRSAKGDAPDAGPPV